MTVSAVVAFSTGVDIRQPAALAYSDVAAAWHNYVATKNNGRPFVLIGHSQGSLMLQMLIANEIEKDPTLAARMKLAIIPGFKSSSPKASSSAERSRIRRCAAAPARPAASSAGSASARIMSRPLAPFSASPTSRE